MQVRRACPSGVGGLADVVKSPAYATAVGLVKYGAERVHIARTMPSPKAAQRMQQQRAERTQPRLGSRIGEWFREVF
jgi:cell division protein FtsA